MNVELTDIIVTKTGDSNEGENCNLYGVNAALLAKDSSVVTLDKGQISSAALGANAVFSYGGKGKTADGSTIHIEDSAITTSGKNSGGLMVSSGGIINATDMTVNTTGELSSPIKSSKGGGKIAVTRGTFVSNGPSSPAIYSMADIRATGATLTSNMSEGVCITGRNKTELKNCVLTANNFRKRHLAMYNTSVLMYDEKDDNVTLSGVNEFKMTGGTINNIEGHVIHVTNTDAKITLDGVNINNSDSSNVLLSVTNDGWGGYDNNAVVELKNMELGGEIVVTKSSTTAANEDSLLDLMLSNSTIFTGTINNTVANPSARGTVNLIIKPGCKFILSGTSYIDSIINEGRVICGDYKLYVNGEEYDDGGSDYPTESTLLLNGTEYTLEDESGKIVVTQDRTTKAILATIREGDGIFTITGSGVNTVVKINRSVKNAVLLLAGLTLDNSSYASVTSEDSSMFIFGNNSETSIKLDGVTNLTGPDSYVSDPVPMISGQSCSLTFNGSGQLVLNDPMYDTVEFTTEYPVCGIANPKGSLTFASGSINALVSGDVVTAQAGTVSITGAAITVTHSGRAGIKAVDGSVIMRSGTLTFAKVMGEGICAIADEDDSQGSVSISGGLINALQVYRDCIRCESINISGGTLNLKSTFETSAEGYYTTGNEVLNKNTIYEIDGVKRTRINVDTGHHCGIRAGRRGKVYSYHYVPPDDHKHKKDTQYTQSASGAVTISGGTINIDTTTSGLRAYVVTTTGYTACSTGVYMIGSPGHGIKSYNTIAITGGKLNISAANNGISADGAVVLVNEPEVTIDTAFEGIEGSEVVIGTQGWSVGPHVIISTVEDGINSASKRFTYTYDDSRNEECNYLKVVESNTAGCNTHIYSGTVSISMDSESNRAVTLRTGSEESYEGKTVHFNATGDCIDCNGALYIDSGDVEIYGQSTTGKLPIRTSEGFTCNLAATVLITGVDAEESSRPRSGSCVFLRPTQSYAADTYFNVKTRGGESIYTGSLKYAGSFLLFISPSLSPGLSYPVTIGSQTYTIRAYSPS